MDDIQYMEKPEWVSWESVASCIREAHKINEKRGFIMPAMYITGEDLKKKVGNGHCLVALHEDKVIGTKTITYKKYKVNHPLGWLSKGQDVVYIGLEAVQRDFQGTDVYIELYRLANKIIKESGNDIIAFFTAEDNEVVQKLAMKKGAKLVWFFPTKKDAKCYSVYMFRWLNGCPYPDWLVNFIFKFSKLVVKTIWKPGYILRFCFWR